MEKKWKWWLVLLIVIAIFCGGGLAIFTRPIETPTFRNGEKIEMAIRASATAQNLLISNYPQMGPAMGEVLINVILFECQGAAECNEFWTQADEAAIQNSLNLAFQHWQDSAPEQADLRFRMNYLGRQATPYEPTKHSSTEEGLWIKAALQPMLVSRGYSANVLNTLNHFELVLLLNDYERGQEQTDWVATIVFTPSHLDSDHRFSDGLFAYTYLGGPYSVNEVPSNGYTYAAQSVSAMQAQSERGLPPDEMPVFISPIRTRPGQRPTQPWVIFGRQVMLPEAMRWRISRDTNVYQPGLEFVLTHEIGHLFGDLDQYAGKPCSPYAGYPSQSTLTWVRTMTQNKDATVLPDCRVPVEPGLMAGTAWLLSTSSRFQTGWVDQASFNPQTQTWVSGSDHELDVLGFIGLQDVQTTTTSLKGRVKIYQLPVNGSLILNPVECVAIIQEQTTWSQCPTTPIDLDQFDFQISVNGTEPIQVKVKAKFSQKTFLINPWQIFLPWVQR